MSSAEATAQTFGFADVEESNRTVYDGVESFLITQNSSIQLVNYHMLLLSSNSA